MKKLFQVLLVLCLTLILTNNVRADELKISDTLKSLPNLNTGVGWSFDKNEIVYLSTLNLIEYKGFKLNGGYASNDNLILSTSYELTNLKKLGVNVPILDLVKIEPVAFIGWGSINTKAISDSEFNYGIGINILDVKF